MIKKILFFVYVIVTLSGCYTFSSTSIDYSKVKTFSVSNFQMGVSNAPGNMGQRFSEKLKDKIRNNTRLNMSTANGDLQFSGAVNGYTLSSLAPKPGETTALQQLKIAVYVKCINNADDSKSWEKSFEYPAQFTGGQSLASVQDQLINEAFDNLIENVFNETFSNW